MKSLNDTLIGGLHMGESKIRSCTARKKKSLVCVAVAIVCIVAVVDRETIL